MNVERVANIATIVVHAIYLIFGTYIAVWILRISVQPVWLDLLSFIFAVGICELIFRAHYFVLRRAIIWIIGKFGS